MREPAGSTGLFTTTWAMSAQDALGADERVRREAQWFHGAMHLASTSGVAHLEFAENSVGVRICAGQADYRFGFRGDDPAWAQLLSGPSASLNRSVREGRIQLDGDRVAGMQWWRLAYMIIEALRSRHPSAGTIEGHTVAEAAE